DSLRGQPALDVGDFSHPLFTAGRAVELRLSGECIGLMGEVSAAGRKQFELRGSATAAELRLAPLIELAQLIPRYREVPSTPAIGRDLNLEIGEQVRWSDVAEVVRSAAGEVLEQLAFKDTYRNDELTQ